ncbi:hypothetical protein BaRGS_00022293, partial [Batillaria attramentaria]
VLTAGHPVKFEIDSNGQADLFRVDPEGRLLVNADPSSLTEDVYHVHVAVTNLERNTSTRHYGIEIVFYNEMLPHLRSLNIVVASTAGAFCLVLCFLLCAIILNCYMKRERHNMLEEAKQARRKSSADDNKKTNPFATKQTETARTTSKRPLLNLFRDTAKRLSGNKKRVAGLARETTPPEVTSGVGGDREASPPRKMRKIRVESLVNFFRRRGGSDKEPLIRRVSESELHEYQEVGPMKPDGASWSAGCIGRVFTKRNSKGLDVARNGDAVGGSDRAGRAAAEDDPHLYEEMVFRPECITREHGSTEATEQEIRARGHPEQVCVVVSNTSSAERTSQVLLEGTREEEIPEAILTEISPGIVKSAETSVSNVITAGSHETISSSGTEQNDTDNSFLVDDSAEDNVAGSSSAEKTAAIASESSEKTAVGSSSGQRTVTRDIVTRSTSAEPTAVVSAENTSEMVTASASADKTSKMSTTSTSGEKTSTMVTVTSARAEKTGIMGTTSAGADNTNEMSTPSTSVLRTAEAEGATGSSIAEDEPEIPLTSPSNEKTGKALDNATTESTGSDNKTTTDTRLSDDLVTNASSQIVPNASNDNEMVTSTTKPSKIVTGAHSTSKIVTSKCFPGDMTTRAKSFSEGVRREIQAEMTTEKFASTTDAEKASKTATSSKLGKICELVKKASGTNITVTSASNASELITSTSNANETVTSASNANETVTSASNADETVPSTSKPVTSTGNTYKLVTSTITPSTAVTGTSSTGKLAMSTRCTSDMATRAKSASEGVRKELQAETTGESNTEKTSKMNAGCDAAKALRVDTYTIASNAHAKSDATPVEKADSNTESFQSDSASGDSDVYVPVTLFIYPPRIIQESDSETCSSHTDFQGMDDASTTEAVATAKHRAEQGAATTSTKEPQDEPENEQQPQQHDI